MTNYEHITSLPLDQFAEWLENNTSWEDTPWSGWFDNNYCSKCEPEEGTMVDTGKKVKFGWCELNGQCKYFKEFQDIPDCECIIKMWLEEKI